MNPKTITFFFPPLHNTEQLVYIPVQVPREQKLA